MNVQIGQTEWSIKLIGSLIEFGITDHYSAVIKLNSNQHPDQLRDSLLHEILHAIVFAYGVPMAKLEEPILKTLTPALLDVLCSNPQLVSVLTGNDDIKGDMDYGIYGEGYE